MGPHPKKTEMSDTTEPAAQRSSAGTVDTKTREYVSTVAGPSRPNIRARCARVEKVWWPPEAHRDVKGAQERHPLPRGARGEHRRACSLAEPRTAELEELGPPPEGHGRRGVEADAQAARRGRQRNETTTGRQRKDVAEMPDALRGRPGSAPSESPVKCVFDGSPHAAHLTSRRTATPDGDSRFARSEGTRYIDEDASLTYALHPLERDPHESTGAVF